MAAGQFCLVSYWLMVWFPGSHSANRNICQVGVTFLLPFPKGFLIAFKNAQRLSNDLWAFPSGFSIHFKYSIPQRLSNSLKNNSQRLSAKTWWFPSFFSKALHFSLYLLKIEDALKNFKNPQRLLSWKYWCDSPLKKCVHKSLIIYKVRNIIQCDLDYSTLVTYCIHRKTSEYLPYW